MGVSNFLEVRPNILGLQYFIPRLFVIVLQITPSKNHYLQVIKEAFH